MESLFGAVILLEYIYNLAEETVEINVETIVPVSADRYQKLREKKILSSIREICISHQVTIVINDTCHHFLIGEPFHLAVCPLEHCEIELQGFFHRDRLSASCHKIASA